MGCLFTLTTTQLCSLLSFLPMFETKLDWDLKLELGRTQEKTVNRRERTADRWFKNDFKAPSKLLIVLGGLLSYVTDSILYSSESTFAVTHIQVCQWCS